MNDSTSPAVAPPAVATSAPRPGTLPPLAFTDAESAKRWANALPLTNVAQLFDSVHGQLKALSAASFAPRERATIAEVLRELVAHLHTELARRYAGKPQPLVDRELEAAEQALSLWQILWEQYSACLKPLLEGDPDLAGVKPKLLQRGLYVGKQLVLVHGLARRVAPPALWQELHAYYRLAEMLECAVTSVSDDLMPQRDRDFLLFDLQSRLAARAGGSVRNDGPPDRAHRPLARDVGAQDLPLRAASARPKAR